MTGVGGTPHDSPLSLAEFADRLGRAKRASAMLSGLRAAPSFLINMGEYKPIWSDNAQQLPNLNALPLSNPTMLSITVDDLASSPTGPKCMIIFPTARILLGKNSSEAIGYCKNCGVAGGGNPRLFGDEKRLSPWQ